MGTDKIQPVLLEELTRLRAEGRRDQLVDVIVSVAGTRDGRLLSLDPETGRLAPDFGTGGYVDLKEGVGKVRPGNYQVTCMKCAFLHQERSNITTSFVQGCFDYRSCREFVRIGFHITQLCFQQYFL